MSIKARAPGPLKPALGASFSFLAGDWSCAVLIVCLPPRSDVAEVVPRILALEVVPLSWHEGVMGEKYVQYLHS